MVSRMPRKSAICVSNPGGKVAAACTLAVRLPNGEGKVFAMSAAMAARSACAAGIDAPGRRRPMICTPRDAERLSGGGAPGLSKGSWVIGIQRSALKMP